MANPKIIFTGVDQASVVVGKIAGTVDKLKLALTGLAGAAAVGIFKGIVDDLDRLEESAQSAGVAVESLSALRYAATFAGVGAENLDEALKRLNVQLAAAAGGAKDAQAVFQALGIKITNTSGQILNSDEALAQIADKFASFRDGPEKAALAVELFGKSGTKLIPFLNQGADGLERMKEEAAKLGVIIGTEAATAASRFADQLDRLAASATAVKVSIFLPIIEGLSKAIEEFNAARGAALGFGEALKFLATQSAGTLQDPGAKIRSLTADIEALQKKIDAPIGAAPYKRRLAEQADALRRELAFLKEIQRNRALANAGTPYSNEGRTAAGAAPRIKRATGGDTKETIDATREALAKYIEELDRELQKLEDISTVEKARRLLAANPALDTVQVRELLATEEKMLDLRQRAVAARKEDADIEARILAQQKSLDEQLETFAGRSADALKIAQTARLEARLAAGELFSAEELDRIVKGIGGIRDEIQKTDDVAKELGLTFASSLGRWIEAPSETNFFKALAQDLQKLLVQMLIVKPLAEQLERIFKGSGVGGTGAGLASLFSLFGSQNLVGVFASGTDYVPRTGLALVHRGEAIVPAGQNGRGWGGTLIVNNYIDGAVDRARIAGYVDRGVRAGIARSVDNTARGGNGIV
jgi:frataxin-like iron-binding protein CyaY